MKPAALYLSLAMALAPFSVQAQEADSEGSLLEQGTEMFLKGLQEEIAPKLDEFLKHAEEIGPQMGAFLEQMGPALGDLMDEVQDWSRYELPEVLPNGDIIIRRKPDTDNPDTDKPGLDKPDGDEPDEEGAIDL